MVSFLQILRCNEGAKKMVKNDKLVAVVSYVTIIGWIIAFVMNKNNKSDLGSFHLRQALLLVIAGLIVAFIPIFIGWILQVLIFVLWIFGIFYAIQGKKKEIPLIGHLAQEWFKGI